MNYFIERRKSYMEFDKIYFWTTTINSWQKLLQEDVLKQAIVDSLHFLSAKGKIAVYAFVVMPNHIHLIWKMLQMNGKELPVGSFTKYTAHVFKKYVQQHHPQWLPLFAVEAENKSYEFWQRDPVAFELTQRNTALQKLVYIHNNPLAEHWQLCTDPVQYKYSSAAFYETGIDKFGFLKHIMDEF